MKHIYLIRLVVLKCPIFQTQKYGMPRFTLGFIFYVYFVSTSTNLLHSRRALLLRHRWRVNNFSNFNPQA